MATPIPEAENMRPYRQKDKSHWISLILKKIKIKSNTIGLRCVKVVVSLVVPAISLEPVVKSIEVHNVSVREFAHIYISIWSVHARHIAASTVHASVAALGVVPV